MHPYIHFWSFQLVYLYKRYGQYNFPSSFTRILSATTVWSRIVIGTALRLECGCSWEELGCRKTIPSAREYLSQDTPGPRLGMTAFWLLTPLFTLWIASQQSSAHSLRVGTFNIKADYGLPPALDEVFPFGPVSSPSEPFLNDAANELAMAGLEEGDRHLRSRHELEHRQEQRRSNIPSRERSWSARRAPLAGQIIHEELDLIGLQEVMYHQLQDLRVLLGKRYGCVGVGRMDGATQGESVSLTFVNASLQPSFIHKPTGPSLLS